MQVNWNTIPVAERPDSRWKVIGKQLARGHWEYENGWTRERVEWVRDGRLTGPDKRVYEPRGDDFWVRDCHGHWAMQVRPSPSHLAELRYLVSQLRQYGDAESWTTALRGSTLLATRLRR